TSMQLGVAALNTYDATDPDAEGATATPSGLLSLFYYQPLGRVTGSLGLSARRVIQPNLLLGTTTTTTSAALNGSLPLPWFFRGDTPTVRISTTAGRAFSELLDERIDDRPTWHVDTVDVSLTWS